MRHHLARLAAASTVGLTPMILTGCVRDPGPPEQATLSEVAEITDVTLVPIDRGVEAIMADLAGAASADRPHLVAEYLAAAARLDSEEEARALRRLEAVTPR